MIVLIVIEELQKNKQFNIQNLGIFKDLGNVRHLKILILKKLLLLFIKLYIKKNKNKLIEKTQQKLNQLKILQSKHSNKNKDCC